MIFFIAFPDSDFNNRPRMTQIRRIETDFIFYQRLSAKSVSSVAYFSKVYLLFAFQGMTGEILAQIPYRTRNLMGIGNGFIKGTDNMVTIFLRQV